MGWGWAPFDRNAGFELSAGNAPAASLKFIRKLNFSDPARAGASRRGRCTRGPGSRRRRRRGGGGGGGEEAGAFDGAAERQQRRTVRAPEEQQIGSAGSRESEQISGIWPWHASMSLAPACKRTDWTGRAPARVRASCPENQSLHASCCDACCGARIKFSRAQNTSHCSGAEGEGKVRG
jgi:hypothetical protein